MNVQEHDGSTQMSMKDPDFIFGVEEVDPHHTCWLISLIVITDAKALWQ